MTIKIEHEFIPHFGIGLGSHSRTRHGWDWYGLTIQLPFIMFYVCIKWRQVETKGVTNL